MGLSKKGRKPKPDHSQKCSAITWPPCSRTTNCSSSKFFCLLQCYPSPYPTWSKLVGPHNVGPICHEGNPPVRWGRFACRGWKERVWSQSQPRRGLQCSVLPTWPVASTIKAPHRLATHSSPRLPLRPPPLRSLTNSISSSPRRKARVSSHQAGKPGSSFPHAAMKNAPRCLCPLVSKCGFPFGLVGFFVSIGFLVSNVSLGVCAQIDLGAPGSWSSSEATSRGWSPSPRREAEPATPWRRWSAGWGRWTSRWTTSSTTGTSAPTASSRPSIAARSSAPVSAAGIYLVLLACSRWMRRGWWDFGGLFRTGRRAIVGVLRFFPLCRKNAAKRTLRLVGLTDPDYLLQWWATATWSVLFCRWSRW